MTVKLIHCKPSLDTKTRVIRLHCDTIALGDLSKAEIRAIYGHIERARDALSRILDRSDGKDA